MDFMNNTGFVHFKILSYANIQKSIAIHMKLSEIYAMFSICASHNKCYRSFVILRPSMDEKELEDDI